MNRFFLFLFFVLLLNGCKDKSFVFTQDAAYRQKESWNLNVKTVDVVNSYVSPEKAPYIDHLMQYSLAENLTEWAHHRLSAQASQGYAVVTIEKASVTQKPLPINKSLMDTFTRVPSHRFEAIASVRIDFMDYRGYPQGYAVAQTKQSLTMLEKTPAEEQQVLVQNLCKTVVDVIDQEIEKSLKKHGSLVLFSK